MLKHVHLVKSAWKYEWSKIVKMLTTAFATLKMARWNECLIMFLFISVCILCYLWACLTVWDFVLVSLRNSKYAWKQSNYTYMNPCTSTYSIVSYLQMRKFVHFCFTPQVVARFIHMHRNQHGTLYIKSPKSSNYVTAVTHFESLKFSAFERMVCDKCTTWKRILSKL